MQRIISCQQKLVSCQNCHPVLENIQDLEAWNHPRELDGQGNAYDGAAAPERDGAVPQKVLLRPGLLFNTVVIIGSWL